MMIGIVIDKMQQEHENDEEGVNERLKRIEKKLDALVEVPKKT
jgi:hypothetical protein